MDYSYFLIKFILILAGVVLSVSVWQALGFGTVLGFLSAGFIVGPSVAGLVTNSNVVDYLSEFGIIFLMFIIGLEIKPSRLWAMRNDVFGLGGLQVVATSLVFFGIALAFGVPVLSAILIGIALAMSSTAIDLQLLNESKESNSLYGQKSLAVLLFQDLMAVPLLALISLFSVIAENPNTAGSFLSFSDIGLWTGKILCLMIFVIFIGKKFVSPIFYAVAKTQSSEAFSALTVMLILLTSFAIHRLGFSMSLGAFLAGIMMSESQYKNQVQANIIPFKAVLIGLFFMTIGMSIDIKILMNNSGAVFGIVAGLMAIKIIIMTLIMKVFKNSSASSFKTAMLLAQGGEFALIALKLASEKNAGVVSPEVANLLILCIVISMFITPLMMKFFAFIEMQADILKPYSSSGVNNGFKPSTNHVLIDGFGRVGRTIAKMLEDLGIPYTALDIDPDVVARGRNAGHSVFFGHATSPEVLKIVRAENANVAVIATDRSGKVDRAIECIHMSYPDLKIFARARNHIEGNLMMEKYKDIFAVPETIESSLELGKKILEELGIEQHKITLMMEEYRENNYSKLSDILHIENTHAKNFSMNIFKLGKREDKNQAQNLFKKNVVEKQEIVPEKTVQKFENKIEEKATINITKQKAKNAKKKRKTTNKK